MPFFKDIMPYSDEDAGIFDISIQDSRHKTACFGVTSTDSYTINPIFFKGGDIGKLAVCGSSNDVAMMGGRPLYLNIAFIIEEGFSGRTIFADNPFFPGKRGLDHIDMILKTHLPLDLIIIMLGTNDAKMIYNASAKDIAYGAGILVDKIRQYNWPAWLDRKPELLLVSPVNILPVGENEKEEAEKSLYFAEYFRKIADSKGTFFLDAALYAKPGSDGLHISAEGHRGLAEALASFLKTSITF